MHTSAQPIGHNIVDPVGTIDYFQPEIINQFLSISLRGVSGNAGAKFS
jgi:hypothetical protein